MDNSVSYNKIQLMINSAPDAILPPSRMAFGLHCINHATFGNNLHQNKKHPQTSISCYKSHNLKFLG